MNESYYPHPFSTNQRVASQLSKTKKPALFEDQDELLGTLLGPHRLSQCQSQFETFVAATLKGIRYGLIYPKINFPHVASLAK
ncbi:hypothetical protein TNCV_4698151 [Trichonephila clavipes]|nr:hypothetical protein TNCV_4698151 [Trichonephila clavipes]